MPIRKLPVSLLATICLAIPLVTRLHAADAPVGQVLMSETYGRVPLHFEVNQGQAGDGVKYLSRGKGYTMYLGSTELVLALEAGTNTTRHNHRHEVGPNDKMKIALLRLKLDGANDVSAVSGEEQLECKTHYFIGKDPARWHTNLSNYGKVRYQRVYPGVDLVFYGNQRQLEYDFVVSPGADPKQITLQIEGTDETQIDTEGNLSLNTTGGAVRLQKPVVYQEIGGVHREVSGRYTLRKLKRQIWSASFEIGQYDATQPLIIDPVLVYSTFLGGSGYDAAWTVGVDTGGNAYVAGETTSVLTNLITPGAFQTNYHTNSLEPNDGFVAKLNSSGSALIYMTYLGGSGWDRVNKLALDGTGNVYLTGFTSSGDFPTVNAFQNSIHGTQYFGIYPDEVFVTKLNTNGSALIYSTYLGGDFADLATGIAVDSSGNAYVTGDTFSTNFPTANPLQASRVGGEDAFVTKLNAAGNGLVYSTYIGGSLTNIGQAIVVDPAGNACVVGNTTSTNFPIANAIQSTNKGGNDAFVLKLNTNGSALVYSTYLGGNKDDFAYGIGLDAATNAYVVGVTASTNFPTTNALQSVLGGTNTSTANDGFIAKFNPSGSTLIYSTYLGGANDDDAWAVNVDGTGNAVVSGQTGSIDFAPFNNYGSINHGSFDAFVAKLNSSGTVLMNFAYLGGTNTDYAFDGAVDPAGNAYVVGRTASGDFPVTGTNVIKSTYGGGTFDAFVVKLYFSPNQLGTRVILSEQDPGMWTSQTQAVMAATNSWSGVGTIPSTSTNGVISLLSTRFLRGSGYDPTYTSFILPLDFQKGIKLDDMGDNSAKFGGSRPWFTRLQKDTRQHLGMISSTNASGVRTNFYNYTTNFENPVVTFGSSAGVTPLYVNQNYRFGLYCGEQYESTNSDGTVFQTPLRILVYRKSDFVAGQTNLIAPIATNVITLPRRTLDQTNWSNFATNAFTLTIETNGLRTTVQLVEEKTSAWGVVPKFANARSGPYTLTHLATAPDNCYVIEGIGVVPLGTNLYPMVTNASGALGWDRLYSIDFDTRPPWRSIFVDAPQFDGVPLPPSYLGKSTAELTNSSFTATVTNVISLASSIYTNLDNSPELRRHPLLDKFVSDMKGDPVALINYVLSDIELSDALAYNENSGQASASVLNQGGINRGALGVYLEGQGSPAEQCALLVYLLRQAGYPAAYVFPTNNNVQMLDTRLSKLLRMQVKGAVTENGQTYTTNSLITVNYPWVVTSISNSCVHIFPWLKDTELVEGLNAYDYMPTNYNTGYKWLRNYIYGDTNILALSTETDAPSVLFPKFLKRNLLASYPGISLDDLGTRVFNRRTYYARFQDMPIPNLVTNQSTVVTVDTLSSSAITNVSPTLTNIFNQVTIEVFSLANTNSRISTGPLRLADLNDRKMFVTTNSATNLMLWLAPFRSDNTNQSSFTNDVALTNKQIANLALATNDQQFAVRTTFERHRSLNFTAPTNQFLGINETLRFVTPDRPFTRADLTAICLNVGRVTPKMLDVHARAYRQMDYQRQLNTNTVPAVEDCQGAAAYLMGMDYYAKVSRFTLVNEQLHKARVVSWLAEGLSKLTPVKLGTQNFVRPSLDMFFNEIAHAANTTLHPDSGNDFLAGTDDFSRILMGEIAAQEHSLVNGYYRSTNAVSSVVLLRLAQQRSGAGVEGIVELNKNNYVTRGNTSSQGFGPNKLKDYDSDIWSAVTNAFQGWDSDYARAFITPGPIPVQAASFRGMGLMILGKSQSSSLITVNMNGVLGEPSAYFGDSPATLPADFTLSSPTTGGFYDGSLDASATYGSFLSSGNLYGSSLYGGNVFGTTVGSFYWIVPPWYYYSPQPYNFMVPASYYPFMRGVATFNSPSQLDLARQINDLNYFATSTPAADSLARAQDSGNTGLPFWKNALNYVAEPVNFLTGEFYDDETDLTLPGPMPLTLSRNYSSQNQDDRNNFGYGWNINLVPYLGMATNTNAVVFLTAVEQDGSVISYRQQSTNANIFIPQPDDNLTLDNYGGGKIGSIYNMFNARIVHSVNGTNDQYTLSGADGQVRTFIVSSYPIVGTTNTVTRQRPYLTTWKDTRGNSYTFTYGTDSTAPEYGQLVRVQSSNGNLIGLNYNAAGYVVEAFTGDDRRVNYEYDDFGDLTRVVLPDASEQLYEYLHKQFTNSGTIYVDSTHLIDKHIKPDGRILENTYDSLRRVTVQKATVGVDLNTYTNATFAYSNNFTLTKMTNGISGFTVVTDVNTNTTRYDYTNSLVTKIQDPINPPTVQDWYFTNGSGGAYQRSLKTKTDPRGLKATYQYDGLGNLTNATYTGDLTGNSITNETATWTYSYNSNNLVLTAADPLNNQRRFYYDTNFVFFPLAVATLTNSTLISSNYFEYYNLTNGGTVIYGLPKRLTRAAGSSDSAVVEFSHDARGFPARTINYTGTGDPNVTNNFVFNARGELIERVDGASRTNRFSYDARDRLESQETIDETGKRLAGAYFFYNANGELTWSDGPAFDPEDYIWRDYDGAGRKTTEIHWRAEARYDASGVQAPVGDDLYATSFLAYDKFNNLTNVTDPLGNYTVLKYDAIGQLLNQVIYASNNVALATNFWTYEPGGQVLTFTNALKGLTRNFYTYTGRLRRQENPDGSFAEWRYDLSGRVVTNKLVNSNYWQTVYDDANRRITRFFKNATTTLATNIVEFDRRGNLVKTTDVEGNVSTNFFDGLDRIKIAAGPVIVSGLGTNAPPNPGGGGNTTNQQFAVYLYDAGGKTLTVTNAIGEKRISYFDALGRPTQEELWSPQGDRVRVSFKAYSASQHSVIVTNGSSFYALASTSYSDNDGNTVLSIQYPTNGVQEYAWTKYDRGGNRTAQQRLSSANSVVTVWATNGWTYDGLNRVGTETTRDGVVTSFSYDSLGDLTNRTMPNGLVWSATYLNDGRIATEKTTGGSLTERSLTYQYYPSNNIWAGLLQTVADGRSTTRSNAYDDFLRVATVTTTGAQSEQQTTTSYQYDRRGLATNLVQSFASTNTGPGSTAIRAYDGYGQLTSENIFNGGLPQAGSGQSWDGAGRRSAFAINSSGYFDFDYQADGQMTRASGTYLSYYDNGLLSSRSKPGFGQEISTRDGSGRPLLVVSVLPGSTLNETLTWRSDGLLNSYSATRSDFTDTRNYSYSSLARRLTQESFNVASSQRVTNSYAFDLGTNGGLGVLTSFGVTGQVSGNWSTPGSGGLDGLRRVAQEQNTTVKRSAIGKALGAANVAATLDGKPVSVTYNGVSSDGRWRSPLEMTAGSHTLRVWANHPSGQFTAFATNTFTLSTNGVDTATNLFDGNGNVTQRVWKNASGTTNRTQTLTWDAFDRLLKVTDRDAQTNGFNWSAVYDALGRRLRTTYTMVLTNVPVTSPASAVSVIDSYYDPETEFLEVGVSVNGLVTWKSHGPDLDQTYGGLQGVGGLDYVSQPDQIADTSLVSDVFGNLIGTVANGVTTWNPARVGSYGPLPGYPSPALSPNVSLTDATVWRGRRVDETGLIYLGARMYDPTSGRFLSTDPLGHAASMDLFSAFDGDGVNSFDPSGRLGKKVWNGVRRGFEIYGEAETRNIQMETGASFQTGINTGVVYDRARAMGESPFGAAYEGGAYGVGSFTGYTPLYEGITEFDIAGAYPITSPFDKWTRIGFGSLGVAGTGFAVGGAVPTQSPKVFSFSTKPAPATLGGIRIRLNPLASELAGNTNPNGRRGTLAHQTDVAINNRQQTSELRPGQVGSRVPDGVGQPGQVATIRGVRIDPGPNGRVIVESESFRNGRPVSDGRRQIRDIRAADPNATIVVTDPYDLTAPPLVYPPGTQPPPGGWLPKGTPPKVPYP